ncbi:hypothetical protein SL1157_1546 [Ruegeria lacuscaerulensis ITI-1157]|nr:hypothetical protein SL1157_1546 [Ruegeria lacuscaerulensis ITI-1157]
MSHVRCHLSIFSAEKGTAGLRHLFHTRRHVRINSWPPSRVAASRSANRVLENTPPQGALSETGSAEPGFLRTQPEFAVLQRCTSEPT